MIDSMPPLLFSELAGSGVAFNAAGKTKKWTEGVSVRPTEEVEDAVKNDAASKSKARRDSGI